MEESSHCILTPIVYGEIMVVPMLELQFFKLLPFNSKTRAIFELTWFLIFSHSDLFKRDGYLMGWQGSCPRVDRTEGPSGQYEWPSMNPLKDGPTTKVDHYLPVFPSLNKLYFSLVMGHPGHCRRIPVFIQIGPSFPSITMLRWWGCKMYELPILFWQPREFCLLQSLLSLSNWSFSWGKVTKLGEGVASPMAPWR